MTLSYKKTCCELRKLVFASVNSNRDRISPAANFKPTWPKNLRRVPATLLRSIDSQSLLLSAEEGSSGHTHLYTQTSWRVGMALWFRPPVYTCFRYTQLLLAYVYFKPVFLIRIRRILMFLASWICIRIYNLFVWFRLRIRLQIRILTSTSKKIKKNRDFYCVVTSLWLFIFEEWCICTYKKE